LELPNCHIFRFYWLDNAGCFLQTVQTFRHLPHRLLELPHYGPKLPDAPFKPFKPSETFQTGAWSCQLWQAKSFLFSWPATAGFSLQTLQTFRNLPNRLLELPNYGYVMEK
jgi:hypothetical protein